MKFVRCLLLLPALTLGLRAGAQVGYEPERRSNLKIIQTEEPVFPLGLRHSTVLTGETSIAIDVDQDGKLTDWLVTSYSRKEFAESAVAALKRWEYEPPRLNGKPWSSVQELHFDFSRTGVVVDMTEFEALTNRMDAMLAGQYAYRSYKLSELDRIPTPIKVVSPAVPPPLARDQSKHTVTVEFHIDEQGKVRLPSVARNVAASAYAAAALDAVKQWRFEPPLYRGRPVLVVARQDFNFVPPKLP